MDQSWSTVSVRKNGAAKAASSCCDFMSDRNPEQGKRELIRLPRPRLNDMDAPALLVFFLRALRHNMPDPALRRVNTTAAGPELLYFLPMQRVAVLNDLGVPHKFHLAQFVEFHACLCWHAFSQNVAFL